MPEPKMPAAPLPCAWPESLAPLDDLFLLAPKDRAVLEGRTGRTRFGREGVATRILGVIILFFGIAIAVLVALPELNLSLQLSQSGRTTEAQVREMFTTFATRHGNPTRRGYYHLVFAFTVRAEDGTMRSYEVETEVPGDLYYRTDPNDRVAIRYLPADPNQAVLVEHDPHQYVASLWLIISAVPCLLAVLALWVGQRGIRLDRRLIEEGAWLQGWVIRSDVKRMHGRTMLCLTYRFCDPQGRQVEKKAAYARIFTRKLPLPPPGTPVAVRYVDERHVEVM